MKKFLSPMVFGVGLFLVVTVLSAPASFGQQRPQGQQESAKQRVSVSYVTNPAGTGLYTISIGQSQVVGKKTDFDLVVQPAGGGPLSVPRLVASKECLLGITSAPILSDAYAGIKEFKGKKLQSLRAVQAGQLTLFGLITYAGTGIKTIPDLKGKRVTWNILTSEVARGVGFSEIKAYGLDPTKDVKPLKAETTVTGINDLAAGRTDAAACSLGGAKIEELATKVKPIVLPFDPDRIGVIQQEMPAIFAAVSKKVGTAIPAGIPVVGAPEVFFAHQDLDEETVYRILKTLLESQEELKLIHRDFAEWSLEGAVKKLPLPYHPGAIRYYKEVGLWSAEMAQHQASLLK